MKGDHVGTFLRLLGDLNGDGVVDDLDDNQLRSSLAERSGASGYLAAPDDHGDGTIDPATNVGESARQGETPGRLIDRRRPGTAGGGVEEPPNRVDASGNLGPSASCGDRPTAPEIRTFGRTRPFQARRP